MDERHRRTKQPSTGLAGPYGHPIHPLLVTIPIGTWFASIAFDVGSLATNAYGPILYRGSMVLIAIGIAVALVAAAFGLIDLLQISSRSHVFRIALAHGFINVSVVTTFAIDLALRLIHRDLPRVPISLLVLSVSAYLLVIVSATLGGTLVYRYGVRVVDERAQAEGFESVHDPIPPSSTPSEA
jgi:uncharacterized membrane protein